MAKNLIIGAYSGYEYNQLRPWILSIEQAGIQADRLLIVGNTSESTVDKLKEHGFMIGRMELNGLPPHIPRWLYVYDYLADNWQNYDYAVMTDLKDVYFQRDPFEWLERNLGDKKIVTGSECLLYKHESWGNQNLRDTFDDYIHYRFHEREIFNVGILGGRPDYLKDLFLQNYVLALREPRALDQGTFNFLVHTHPWSDVTYFAKQWEGWACQAGTVADPRKMADFRPNLLEPEPEFRDGVVYTSKGEPFYIVHQYDRVPAWAEHVKKTYQ